MNSVQPNEKKGLDPVAQVWLTLIAINLMISAALGLWIWWH